MKTDLIPTGYRILIKPDELEKVSGGGIVLVHQDERLARAATVTGVIVAIGKTAWDRHQGGLSWCDVGDHVIYAKYAGKIVIDPETEEEFLIVNDEDILALKGEK